MTTWPLTLVFSISLIVSSSLLFSVQPMVSKMMLPMLGGAPSVWTTAMVFFQGALFVGYAYAFLSSKYLTVRAQIILHLVALLGALLILPVTISDTWAVLDMENPQIWVLTVLLAVVAWPFVAVAGSATLLQNWFAHSNHRSALDPYFLYAASNLGSIVALLAYPFVLEPRLTLQAQSQAWSLLYLVLVPMTACCGASVWRSSRLVPSGVNGLQSAPSGKPSPKVPPNWTLRLQWLVLSFAPSMMLLGVTLHIQTDIAAIPFLWVGPLSIYLLTFIVTFYKRQFFARELVLNLHAFVMISVALFLVNFQINYLASIVLHLSVLFFSGLVCHAALVGLRPAASHLGEFYLWVSAGGWLGGLAAGLIAPLIFDSVLEYPIAIILVCMLRAPATGGLSINLRTIWIAVATIAFFLAFNPWYGLKLVRYLPGILAGLVLYGGMLIGMFAIRRSPPVFTAMVAFAILGMKGPGFDEKLTPLFQKRSFFGVTKVVEQPASPATLLFSGSTLHGFQLTKTARHRQLPTGFYHSSGPIGHVIRGKRDARSLAKTAIIGLGAGTLACHFEKGEELIFFEVDPVVIEVAATPELFTYLSECGVDAKIRLGDGRLLASELSDATLDLLIIDAFSSDSIPAHLLTREAFRLYFQKLLPDGAIAVHISNRHLDLGPMLARVSAEEGLAGLIWHHTPDAAETERTSVLPSRWVVLSRDTMSLKFLQGRGLWSPIESAGIGDLWTDDFSNVLGTIGSYE